MQTNAVYLKQKADGPLCPQPGHSIYDRRVARGRQGLAENPCVQGHEVSFHWITAMPQIWFPGHKGPVKGSLGREVAPPHMVPQTETKEQNTI